MNEDHNTRPEEKGNRSDRPGDSGTEARRKHTSDLPSRQGRRRTEYNRGQRPPVDPDLAAMLTTRRAPGAGTSAPSGSNNTSGSAAPGPPAKEKTPDNIKGPESMRPPSLSNLWPDSAPPSHGKPMYWPGSRASRPRPTPKQSPQQDKPAPQPNKKAPEQDDPEDAKNVSTPSTRKPAASDSKPPSDARSTDEGSIYVPEVFEDPSNGLDRSDRTRDLPRWTRIESEHRARPDQGQDAGRSEESRREIPADRQIVRLPAVQPLFPGSTANSDDGSDVGSYVRVFRRRAGVMLMVACLIWAAVAAFLVLVPSKYEASSTLLVDTRGFQTELEDLPRLSGERPTIGVPKVANQALILQSSFELAEKAAQTLRSMQEDGSGPSRWTIFDDLPEGQDRTVALVTRLREDYVQVVTQSGEQETSDAITILATSTEPAEASLISNVFSRVYIQSVDDLTNTHFEEALAYYRDRYSEKTTELEGLESRIQEFVEQDGDLLLKEDATHLLNQIATLRTDLDDARIEASEYEATIASLEDEMKGMGEQLVAERAAHGLEDQLDGANGRIAEINLEVERYYTRNPDLRSNPSPSEDLVLLLTERTSLANEVQRISEEYSDRIVGVGGVDLRSQDGTISYMATMRRQLADSRVKLSAARARESAILSRLVQYEERRRVLPQRSVEFAELQNRQARVNVQLIELEDRVQAIEDASRSRRTFARVVSPALVPAYPVRSPILIIVFGLMFGLLAGVGAGFGRERFDGRIFESRSIENDDLDLIGTIPAIRSVRRKKSQAFFDRVVTSDLIAILQPQSPAARAIRSIPMRLRGERKGIRTMVFTGVNRGDGSSFMAANTAAVLAQSGVKVLLLDADIDHPSVVRMLGLSDKARLDLEEATFADGGGIEAFSRSLPNLFSLALQGPTDGTGDYLLANHLVPVIERVRNHFDVIVIDTPPTSESTAALGLSHVSDETIIVARSARTDRAGLRNACDDFHRAAGHSARVVLNAHGKA